MKYVLHVVVLPLFFLQLSHSKFFKTGDEKIVTINYVQSCKENNDNTYDMNILIRKYNRTHMGISMNISVLEPFDHTFEIEFEMKLWSDGGWKNKFVHIKNKNACNSLYMLFGPVWATIIDAAHCNRGCPVLPGFYYFDNMFVDVSACKLILQPGRFFVTVRLSKNNIVPACLEGEFDIKTT